MAVERAGDFDYEAGGSGYSLRRRTDPRIASLVHAELGDARTVVNVGAGAGSYEPDDRYVVAVEPSAEMRSQRPPHRVPAIDARAEHLPFDDASFDAAMAMVTLHQWSDVDSGLTELRRVSRGPVVILTFEGDKLDLLWLDHYAPELIEAERGRYPAIGHICEILGGECRVATVPVPFDCVDGFTEAYFGRPEAFLDAEVRRSQSAWGFVEASVEPRFTAHLESDLASGRWDRDYGQLRTQPEFLGALRLVTAFPVS